MISHQNDTNSTPNLASLSYLGKLDNSLEPADLTWPNLQIFESGSSWKFWTWICADQIDLFWNPTWSSPLDSLFINDPYLLSHRKKSFNLLFFFSSSSSLLLLLFSQFDEFAVRGSLGHNTIEKDNNVKLSLNQTHMVLCSIPRSPSCETINCTG